MNTSKTGYLKNSPDVNNPQNIIEGGSITMKGVGFKVLGEDDKGYRKLMYPDNDYNFRHAKYVLETPVNNKTTKLPFQKLWDTK